MSGSQDPDGVASIGQDVSQEAAASTPDRDLGVRTDLTKRESYSFMRHKS